MNSDGKKCKLTKQIVRCDRRQFLSTTFTALAATTLAGTGLISCSNTQPAIRVGSNIWPGYEFLFLARELHYLNQENVRMVELPSASVCLEALAAGTVEGACLTLDEVLTAQAGGLDLRVVTVLDISMGADVLLAKPHIKTLADLKGRKVGVEQSAVGAVMLHSALEEAGLDVADIQVKHMNVNHHRDAYLNGEVDVLVTFEPVVSQLANTNPTKLFTSADIPGRIVDVIAVRPEVLENRADAVRELVKGHFMALEKFQIATKEVSSIMAYRLKVEAGDVPELYADIELPDVSGNRELLQGTSPKLEQSINKLVQIMVGANLLPKDFTISKTVDGRFLPAS